MAENPQSLTERAPAGARVLMLDRTAFRMGWQGSTSRLIQLAGGFLAIGATVELVRSGVAFVAEDGAEAMSAFPGDVLELPLNLIERLSLPGPLGPLLRRSAARVAVNQGQIGWRSARIEPRVRSAGRGARPQHPTLIWAVCKGTLENARAAATLARRLRVPWVVSFHDPPTEVYLAGRLRSGPRVRAVSLIRDADVVCTTNRDLRSAMIGDLGLAPERCINIPFRLSASPQESIPPTDERGNTERETLTLVYAGRLHGQAVPGQRSLVPLLEGIAALRRTPETPTIILRSAGSGDGFAEAAAAATRLGIGDAYEHLGVLSARDVIRLHEDSDAAVIVQGATQRMQLPNKTFELLALPRPILALIPHGSEVEHVLTVSGKAVIVDVEAEVHSIAVGLQRLVSLWRRGSTSQPEALDAALAEYDPRTLPSQLRGILDAAATQHGATHG